MTNLISPSDMALYFALLLILPEAVYEGLRERHAKASFTIEFLYRASLVIILMAFAGGTCLLGNQDYFLFHVGGYVLVRFAIFDIVYSLFANQPLRSHGTTKIYDRMLAKVPDSLLPFLRFIALFMGVVFLLK